LHSIKSDIKVESPIGGKNWGIGCIGQDQQGAGFWESWGTPETPRSLYYQQLEDRLGTEAVENVTIPEQRGNEPIWSALENWAGIGNLSKFPTSVVAQDVLPDKITLFQNYPNPFNPETSIGFSIANSNKVQIAIYNILGEKIKTLVNRTFTQGIHSAKWDGANAQGHQVPSGVYFYRMKTGNNIEVKKMMLVR